MGIRGRLSTMPLGDLLHWICSSGRTGCLQIEKNRITTAVFFRDGHVIACSSDGPAMLLGQFLVFRGVIDEATLREAMAIQNRTGRMLGQILNESGAIEDAVLDAAIAAKARETLLGLFDDEDAGFWYEEGLAPGRTVMRIDLDGEDIEREGRNRRETLRRIRDEFPDPGAIPCKTARTPDPAELRGFPERRIYEAVDGERSIGNIVLVTHGTEFAVLRHLSDLLAAGLIEVPERSSAPEPIPAQLRLSVAEVGEPEPAAPVAPPARTGADSGPILEEARHLMEQGRFEDALELLGAANHHDPSDQQVSELMSHAENAVLEELSRAGLPPSKVPVLALARESVSREGLAPAEEFLLDMIDGSWDVRSLTWIAPMRVVEVLRALNKLLGRKMIRLEDPVSEPATAP